MAALAGGRARAGSWSATLEPGYGHVDTDVTDQSGVTSHESSDSFLQRYRLSLDLPLTEFLVASAGGTYAGEHRWTVKDGRASEGNGDTTTFYGRLALGAPTVSGGAGVDRTQQRILTGGLPTFVTENYSGFLLWRPVELPELELRAGRLNSYEVTRVARDNTNDSASLALRYERPRYDLRYVLSWSRNDDHAHDSRLDTVEQDLFATRSDTFFAGRTTTYLNAALQARTTTSEARGPGATFTRQQLPVAGLSAVETPPIVPQDVALVPNGRLVDGDLRTSANVNVGYEATRDLRDVGAQFADLATPVNRIYVFIDDPLTPDIGAALATGLRVFQSTDNQLWTEIIPDGVPFPSQLDNRLEIAIPETAARYLKVVLAPLAVGVTTNTEYRDTSVTEVQFLLQTTDLGRRSAISANASGYARTVIVRAIDFAHDISLSLAHDTDSDLTRWTLVNGLSAQHRAWRDVTWNTRVARQDQDIGVGHEGLWQWTAGLIGRPLPTAYWSVLYSGNARHADELAHSLSALARADLYDGISGQMSGTVTSATRGTKNGQSGQASGTLSMTPNRWVTVTIGGLFNRTRTTDSVDGSAVVTQYARADATLALTPAPALSATGTVSRVFLVEHPTTLGTVQLNYFPLRGDLQLSVGYSRTFDTANGALTEVLSPLLRWNVRRGVSLTGSYSLLRNESPASVIESRAILLTLLVTL